VTPPEFIADVERARDARCRGDLRLFAHECRELSWAPEGLRAIGRAQLDIDARADARESFAWLREVRPQDGEANRELAELAGATVAAGPGRVPLFTGHMIDAPGRKQPRFPPTAAAERTAHAMIADAVDRQRAQEPASLVGVAGGACGGDILFHEICAERDVPTRLYLALPPAEFIEASVRHGGESWVARLDRLLGTLPTRVLSSSQDLPRWVAADSYSIWQRNNLWTLFNALSLDAASLALIALWDQGPSDGPGGTDDLVRQVRERGFAVERLPAERLREAVP
jgi:hypothetical protein